MTLIDINDTMYKYSTVLGAIKYCLNKLDCKFATCADKIVTNSSIIVLDMSRKSGW